MATSVVSVSLETKRRRVRPPTRTVFNGTSLVELLSHLRTNAPCVVVEALDALGAPVVVSADSAETQTDESVESIRITAPGAFVAKIDGLGGAARLETLLLVRDGDETQVKNKTKTEAQTAKTESVRITVAPCAEEVEAADVTVDGAAAAASGTTLKRKTRTSRAHVLLTQRARETFALADGDGLQKENKTAKKHLLNCVAALVTWLDEMHDVFTTPDMANDGKILAPDIGSGGCLVPSRLLRRER